MNNFAQTSYEMLALHRKCREQGIELHELALMCCVIRRFAVRMSDIATMLSVSSAAATGIVDKLEKLGLVQRVGSLVDRRKKFIELTETGKETVQFLIES